MIRNAKKDTNFGHADDRLSRLASRLIQAEKNLEFSYEEMHAYGAPSECGKLISDSFLREIDAIYRGEGITEPEFFRAMEERTSPRWVYFCCGIAMRGVHENDNQ